MIKAAGNKQAIKAVRRAIKSTEGAFRHLDLKICRETLNNEKRNRIPGAATVHAGE